jgi:cell division septum initiation protein DivIVA
VVFLKGDMMGKFDTHEVLVNFADRRQVESLLYALNDANSNLLRENQRLEKQNRRLRRKLKRAG